MILFIGFMIVMFLAVLLGAAAALNNFGKNIDYLFRQSPMIKGELIIDKEKLPAPVWRYFLYALGDHQRYISYARLRHYGKFKTALDSEWSEIRGEEYFTVHKPGFIWKGRIGLLTAIDSYIAGSGSLKVYFFNFIRIVHGSGAKFTQGELLRWLGESVWFPTALLPNKSLKWEAIDDYHAKLLYAYNNTNVYYIVTFNEDAQITTLETMRYQDGKSLCPWIGKLSNYEMYDGVMVPTTLETNWKQNGKDFPYAIFHLSMIEYDRPTKFIS